MIYLDIISISYINYQKKDKSNKKSKNSDTEKKKIYSKKCSELKKNHNNTNSNNAMDNLGGYNPNFKKQQLFNLPKVNSLMSDELKEQIRSIDTKFYYNNCAVVN